jgi:hypothetical protein
MDVPAGKLGTELNSLVAKYSGAKTDPNTNIPLTIGVGGTYNNPTPKLVTTEQTEAAKTAAVNAAKEEGGKALQKAVKGTEAEKAVDKILGGINKKKDTTATATTDTTKAVTQPKTAEQEVKQKVEDEAKKKINSLLNRKKKN